MTRQGRARWERLVWIAAGLLTAGCGDGPASRSPAPRRNPPASTRSAPSPGSTASTATEMRQLRLHVLEDVTMEVHYLEGRTVSLRPDLPVVLDDKESFWIDVESAETFVDYESLSRLMNEYVFAFSGAPVSGLEISQEEDADQKDLVELKGHLTAALGTPFEIEGRPEVTPEGGLRIRTTDIQAMDIEVEGLLDLLGVEAEDLIPSLEERGVGIEGNDVILLLDRLMPPPRISGRATSVQVTPEGLILRLGDERSGGSSGVSSGNYLYYQGGTIRIGRMTMTDADLLILDQEPNDPFEFSADRLNEQLQAGYAKLQPDGGLVMHVPDLGTTGKPVP